MSIVPAYLQPVAVFGATGKQGGSVVHHLAAAGVRVIAITRTPAGPKSALFPEGVDVRHGDLDAHETLDAALNGAKSVFLVTDFWSLLASGKAKTYQEAADMEVKQGLAAIAAIRRAGVEFVVFSGLEDVRKISGGKLNVPHFQGKADIEAAMRAEAGLHCCFLHLSSYLENFIQMVALDGRELDLSLPCPRFDASGGLYLQLPTHAMMLFPVTDLGAAVVTILSNPTAHDGVTHGLVSEVLTGEQIADKISVALGQPVGFRAVTVAEFRSYGFPGAEELADMFEFMDTYGYSLGRSVEDTKALIPKLTTFDEWAAAHAVKPSEHVVRACTSSA